jgi:hypothetical protein
MLVVAPISAPMLQMVAMPGGRQQQQTQQKMTKQKQLVRDSTNGL